MNTYIENIKDIVSDHLSFLSETYNVKKVGIFGSVVRGEQKKSSDIDMLVELSKPIGLFKFVELENFLSKVLKRKVDLTTKNAIKPLIKEEILKETIYV